MSTHIIDELKAIRIPNEAFSGDSYARDMFILCELGGDNNLINSRTNRRARSWSAVAIGQPWQVIGQVCKYAGDFEGGMLKFSTGRGTPEAYIRRVRKAMKAADTLGSSELSLTFKIRFNQKEKENGAKWAYGELIKAGVVPKIEERYGETEDVFYFSSAELVIWAKGVHDNGWRNVEIYGPRTN